MNLEDILAIDTTPIDEEMVYDIGKIWGSTYASSHLSVEKWVRFLLLYRYIEKFIADMDIAVSLPTVNYCLSGKDESENIKNYIMQRYSGEFAEKIFTQVMTECNWQYRIMAYKGKALTRLPETEPCQLGEWKSAAKLVRKMKKSLKPNCSNAKYYIFWNYGLGWYLQFRKCNPRKVELAFSEGDKKIEELLKEICRPLCIKFGKDFGMLDAGRYLLGLFEGWNGDGNVNFRMMNSLFFIRIVVLDKLLEHAMELFKMED